MGGAGKVGMLGKALGDVGRTAAESQLSKVGTPQTPEGPVVQPTPPPQNNPFGGFNSGLGPSSSLADSILAGRQNARRRPAFA
jgi:hypothetical protein